MENETFVYIGTYSLRGSEGIYVYALDAATGALRDTGLRAKAHNASFVALHPNGRALYAVSEADSMEGQAPGERGGSVSAFAIDAATGGLSFLNQRSSRGAAPCHIAIDATGRVLVVANYSGGSVASLPIAEDGQLGQATAFFQHEGSGPNRQRQEGPHAHSTTIDGSNRFALACDLGLDKILAYKIDEAKSQLSPPQVLAASTRPGAGPRHFAFHPAHRFGYVMNELDSTITAFTYQAESGQLQEIHTISTLPKDFMGHSSGADIHVLPSGKYLYASNRGHDSLAIFAIDGKTGRLTLVGHQPTQGKTPRNFAIHPSGALLLAANQDSDSVVVFRIDAQSGMLTQIGPSIKVPSPVCVQFGVR